MKTQFREHRFKQTGKYRCDCGVNFQRSAKTYWTENPFHEWQGREEQLNAEETKKLEDKLAKTACPKCGAVCKRL